MSIESMAIVLHHSRAAGTAKIVMLGIANHDGDGGAWPAVATLAKYANVSRRNVQKAIDTLEQMGELKRHKGRGGDHSTADYHRPNLYEITLRCPDTCDRSKNHRTRSTLGLPDFDPVSLATPKPSLNSTMETREKNSSYRARASERCANGHPIIDRTPAGTPFCAVGCAPALVTA